MVLETKIRFNFCYSIFIWASTYLDLVFAMYSCLNFLLIVLPVTVLCIVVSATCSVCLLIYSVYLTRMDMCSSKTYHTHAFVFLLKNLFLSPLCDETGKSFEMFFQNPTHENWQKTYRVISNSHLLLDCCVVLEYLASQVL